MAASLSEQISHLDRTALTRYHEKLTFDKEGLPDPYILSSGWCDRVEDFPELSYPDIYNYLINTPGEYTHESLKSFRSLEAWAYYESNFVQTVYFHQISDSSKVGYMKTKVTPSQRLNEKPHEPWILVHKVDSFIAAAHCTCKAG